MIEQRSHISISHFFSFPIPFRCKSCVCMQVCMLACVCVCAPMCVSVCVRLSVLYICTSCVQLSVVLMSALWWWCSLGQQQSVACEGVSLKHQLLRVIVRVAQYRMLLTGESPSITVQYTVTTATSPHPLYSTTLPQRPVHTHCTVHRNHGDQSTPTVQYTVTMATSPHTLYSTP